MKRTHHLWKSLWQRETLFVEELKQREDQSNQTLYSPRNHLNPQTMTKMVDATNQQRRRYIITKTMKTTTKIRRMSGGIIIMRKRRKTRKTRRMMMF